MAGLILSNWIVYSPMLIILHPCSFSCSAIFKPSGVEVSTVLNSNCMVYGL